MSKNKEGIKLEGKEIQDIFGTKEVLEYDKTIASLSHELDEKKKQIIKARISGIEEDVEKIEEDIFDLNNALKEVRIKRNLLVKKYNKINSDNEVMFSIK